MGIRTSSDTINKGKEGIIELSQEMTTARRNNVSKRNRRGRHGKPPPPPVQTLFNTCKELLAHDGSESVPKAVDVERICSIMDGVKPEDVGLGTGMPFFRVKKSGVSPVISYLHIHECEQFSIGIFCLPPSGMIPLHNHPGMTVFSKLLFGTMHIKSYDWVDSDVPPNVMALPDASQTALDATTTRLAKLKINSEFRAPCNTSVLYPNDGGNMHCFTAITPCAVLDVLTPPYSEPNVRHCAYFHAFPFNQVSVEGVTVPESEEGNYAWLEEKERPADLIVIRGRYTGPKVTKT